MRPLSRPLAYLVPLVTLVACAASACSGDNDQSDGGAMQDAGSEPDAAPPDPDAGGDMADAADACGQLLASGEELEYALHAVVDDSYLYVLDQAEAPKGDSFELRVWRFHRERGGADLLGAFPITSTGRPGGAYPFNSRLVMDADSVYVAWDDQEAGGVLVRVPKDGSGVEAISSDATGSLAVDDTHVYWSTDYIGGEFQPVTIKRRAKAGGEEEILFQDERLTGGAHIVLADDHLLWAPDLLDSTLRRIPIAGGPPEALGDLAPDAPGVLALRVADDGRLYWSTFGWSTVDGFALRLFRGSVDPFEIEPVVTTKHAIEGGSNELFVVDGSIYWHAQTTAAGSPDDQGIRRASIDGGEPPLTVYGATDVGAWAPSPAGVYVAHPSGGVRVIPLEGCGAATGI